MIQSDLFGMVKWPFEGVKWPPTRGWKGHFESPGYRKHPKTITNRTSPSCDGGLAGGSSTGRALDTKKKTAGLRPGQLRCYDVTSCAAFSAGFLQGFLQLRWRRHVHVSPVTSWRWGFGKCGKNKGWIWYDNMIYWYMYVLYISIYIYIDSRLYFPNC